MNKIWAFVSTALTSLAISKINWAQYVGIAAMVYALFTHRVVSAESQAQLVSQLQDLVAELVTIQGSVHGVTLLLRTFFNKATPTPMAVAKSVSNT